MAVAAALRLICGAEIAYQAEVELDAFEEKLASIAHA